ncbi:hypothetical protein L198_04805 [Cryptococcus wingfieldii CBS 7118]|uniref:Signal transduction-related protein n=1 Tax=Cryptococcus wingfieldii CBS 7118 TaxID=1295528 RepID=A0A1E3J1G0_9TREE|nr:hypothetical protein L198_04805 [Cryptococcus wingfieldii CBS 7118]ODN94664.1 hypothetical protein L198_04805 [Cryptococcus wingfieldii CBS 7118]
MAHETFSRYLQENLTPEWKRAYIDYRACKKSIKVIAARMGHIQEEGEGDQGDSSGPDDDYGPSAPPKKTPEIIKGPHGGSGSLKIRMNTTSTPQLGRNTSRPSPSLGRSPHYGSTDDSHHVQSPCFPQSLSNIPPPLDLGAPGVEDDYVPASPGVPPRLTVTTDQKERDHAHRKGVAFSPTQEEIAGQRIDEVAEASETSPASDESARKDDAAEPLTRRPADLILKSDKSAPSPRMIGKSPKALFTPRLSSIRAESARGKSPGSQPRSLRSMTLPSPALSQMRPPGATTPVKPIDTFEDLYDRCEKDEKAFFDLLQRELDKVEKFYVARESEAIKRAHDLRIQLRELAEHRKLYHELYPEGMPEWEVRVGRILPTGAQPRAPALSKIRNRIKYAFEDRESLAVPDSKANGAKTPAISRSGSPVMSEHERQSLKEAMEADKDHNTYSPERYQKYKKDLRNALMEFYRQLELIKNYRILNLTGFRKALKKFEKTTKIESLELYTDEHISRCTFSKSEAIDNILKQVEDLYTIHFEHGDSKKAREKLRRQQKEKTHYQSVFRSGIMMGIALPAFVAALVECDRQETRDAIPAWEGLLVCYGGLYLPVVFALLFEVNLLAYVNARINYEFVMELTRPTIDYRSYIELPSFLFLTLSYCFYFSFARIGSSNVAPTTWPAAWLVFFAVFWINPFPIFRRQTRYWLLKVLFRVITPGYSRVEFIAFFLADELNSLTYSIQNVYFLSCAYANHWPDDVVNVCPSGRSWPYAIIVCLPALSRLIQCLKRYNDSKLYIHLINAGKYASVMTQLCLFVWWRNQGSRNNNASFIVWVIFAFFSATYACSWDFIVDWSVLRPKAGFLRKDLGYSRRFVYYLAMVINVLLRFIFIWYIPASTRHVRTRSFVFAAAEVGRRWQWNFFRVETEHLGNADAYRVTREIPLPYRRIQADSDEDDSDSPKLERTKSLVGGVVNINLDRLRRGIRGDREGRGPDALDIGARGHAEQREYESSRPGDVENSPRGAERV